MKKRQPIIMKFGGTSVSTKHSIETLCNIVVGEKRHHPVVVVSALTGITDKLLAIGNGNDTIEKDLRVVRNQHERLIDELWKDDTIRKATLGYIDKQIAKVKQIAKKQRNKANIDALIAYGEIMSSYIVALALSKHGILSKQVIATYVIATDASFGSAEFLVEPTKKRVQSVIRPLVNKGIVPVVTGFIGATGDGKTTTLGRGGSDYTASIIGYCLSASEIQIWTDVNGIMTADPKIVKNARNIDVVSYEEASELAILGAKVLHPKTILPAVEKNIPVKILNTHNPTYKGTTILKKVNTPNYIRSIACKKGIQVIDIHAPKMFLMHGFLYKVFKIFNELAISVDFVSTSEVSISLTIEGKYDTSQLVKKLIEFADVRIKNHHATVSVVGKPPGTNPVIPGRVYTILENKNIDIEMISTGISKINETIVVREKDADDVVRILHNKLIIKKGVL